MLPNRTGRLASLGLGILRLVVKRTMSRPILVLFTMLGLIVCVALVSAVPFYADGVVERLLKTRVGSTAGAPAVAIQVKHLEDKSRPTTPTQYQRLNDYVTNSIGDVVGLPVKSQARYMAVSSHRIVDYSVTTFTDVWVSQQMRYGEIASLTDLESHIRILEGRGLDGNGLPKSPSPDAPVPVIVSGSAADQLQLKVGDRYWYMGPNVDKLEKLGVEIVGIWEPVNPKDSSYWLTSDPETTYQYTLFAGESDFFNRVIPSFPESKPALREYTWYVVFDELALHSTKVDGVRRGLRALELDSVRLMPDTKIVDSPLDTLDWFSREVGALRTLLLVLSIPLLAVALYYVSISLTMVMDQRRGEIAFLRSRGASPFQIVMMCVLETAIVGVFALAIGIVVAIGVAQLIGTAFGFLMFARRAPLPVYFGQEVLEYGLVAIALGLLCTLYPAIRSARLSIVAYVQQSTRTDKYLSLRGVLFDLFWVGVAGYGYYSLRSGSSVVRTGAEGQYVIEPLLLVLPAVFICALALVFRRLVPLLGSVFAGFLSRFGGAPTLLAVREIYRAPGSYSSLVFLLVVTLAVGIYSASAARTLETNFSDRARYASPADLELAPNWEVDPETGALTEPPQTAFEVDGVRAITRKQSLTGRLGDQRSGSDLQVLGIERDTFAEVAWWRSDFAPVGVAGLVSKLGSDERAVIVSKNLIEQRQLRIGDVIPMSFISPGRLEPKTVEFVIVDAVDYFPTQYPARTPFVVANLAYLQDQLGLSMYEVWLAIEPEVRSGTIITEIENNGVIINRILDQRVAVNVGRLDPQRTGIVGLLSLTFIVAALLTVLGYTLHTLLSLQQRMPQMGVLRTIGLSAGQLVRLLVTEQAFIVAISVVAGVTFGALASQLFVPFLQVDVDRLGQTPPFIIEGAWSDVRWILLVLGLMLGAGTGITYALSRRMRLNQAVQLGSRV